MSLSTETINYLAGLSRLNIKDTEIEKLASELSSIVDYVSTISEIDVTSKHDVLSHNVFRDDAVTVEAGVFKVALLKNAPKTNGDYISVVKVL